MLNLDFRLDDWPARTDGYHPIAYTEGVLDIIVDGESVLRLEGVLLVEFAVALQNWLTRFGIGPPPDLIYSSMDFEDDPLVSLTWQPEASVFGLTSAYDESVVEWIRQADAQMAAVQYLEDLEQALGATPVDLPAVLRRAAK